MKKKWIFLGVIVALGALQLTFLEYSRIFYVKPDLLLIAVVIATLRFDFREALFLSFLAGFFKDCFVSGTLGLNTLLFPLWCYLIFKITRQFMIEEEIFQIPLVTLAVILHNVTTGFIAVSQGTFISFGIFLRILIIDAILTTAVCPLVFRVTKPIFS